VSRTAADPFDERGVADGPWVLFVVRDASVGVLFVSPPRPRMSMGDGLAKQIIFRLVAGLEHGKTCHAALFEIAALARKRSLWRGRRGACRPQ